MNFFLYFYDSFLCLLKTLPFSLITFFNIQAGGYDAAGERYKKELDGREGKLSDLEYSDLIERVINFE